MQQVDCQEIERVYNEVVFQPDQHGGDFVDKVAQRQLDWDGMMVALNDDEHPDAVQDNGDDIGMKRKPLLFVGEKPLDAYDNSQRRINYLDSSIWCRYADGPNRDKVAKKIEMYSALGLYDNMQAQELLDFNARLVQQSHIKSFPDGRADHIVPFVFHSESRVAESVETLTARMATISGQKKLRWRMMLVDDELDQHGFENGIPTDKARIICSILSEDFKVFCRGVQAVDCSKSGSPSGEIELVCVPMDMLLYGTDKKFFNQRFDLVLLDYAFPNKDGSARYSYDLLSAIGNSLNGTNVGNRKKWSQRKGIFGKFWFFHISPFSVAIEEKLQEKGFSHHTEDWHIGRGACPIVTPELFRYNLARFMLRQIEIITRLPLHDEENPDYIVTLIDLLDKIFKAKNVREAASRYFNALLELRARYRTLKKDLMYVTKNESNESLLVASLFPDLRDYSNSFWEHLVHLVYTVAYGTIRQWNEMWEELLFIKTILDTGESTLMRKNGMLLSENIESYILKLKDGGK